ncbi:MAG: DHH family phosphoesterase [Idiomarina sp.]|nr:DHH family phosphoesterase [Idiomarina sp.]
MSRYIDVFNGDADGILALVILRRVYPVGAEQHTLISDVKRHIQLVERVQAEPGDKVTVLDLSYDANAKAIDRLLAKGVEVLCCDHHQARHALPHPKLTTVIDESANCCTALLVFREFAGGNKALHCWAIAALFGDGLMAQANAEADELGLAHAQRAELCELGTLLNYNGYGRNLADLMIPPTALFAQLINFEDPFELIAAQNASVVKLREQFNADIQRAQNEIPYLENESLIVLLLPDADWARRISGTIANQLMEQQPNKAVLVATPWQVGELLVSLRAPRTNNEGAGELCSQFPGGGGRAGAGGITGLPNERFDEVVAQVEARYRGS